MTSNSRQDAAHWAYRDAQSHAADAGLDRDKGRRRGEMPV